ncbi:NAD(P)-binding domain-containing protein [Halobellus sp. GM3]|uniref:NAD(P)-binding domain-containing protein n=1 Tax=Halobellus sp. GM3 TaxID=3458410 RepID=UPI00403D67D7
MTSVGYIGLGTMGKPMAENLVADGYEVTVFDLRAEAVEALESQGADGTADASSVAERAEIIFLSLPSPPVIEDVVAELKPALSSGDVIVDLSTSVPAVTEEIADELAELGVDVLGAPVTGGRPGATDGTLTVMVGGEESVLDRCQPIMESFANDIIHIGESPGDGDAVKLLRNYIGFAQDVAASEAVLLGQKSGLDPEPLLDVLDSADALGEPTSTFLPKKIEGEYDLGFGLGLMEKDLKLLAQYSEDNDAPLMLGNAVRQIVGYGTSDLGKDADNGKLHQYLKEMIHREDA